MRCLINLIFPMSFENNKLGPEVETARHALSIDDERLSFAPELWDERKEGQRSDTRKRIKQVWFPGVHSNVGGISKARSVAGRLGRNDDGGQERRAALYRKRSPVRSATPGCPCCALRLAERAGVVLSLEATEHSRIVPRFWINPDDPYERF